MKLDALLDDQEVVAAMPFGGDGATVLIRYVPQDKLREIHRRAMKRGWDENHQPTKELDINEANRLLGRAAVAGWSGFPQYHGEELAYSPEACDRLMNKWGEFSRFVNDACVDYARLVAAEREDTKKNSAST